MTRPISSATSIMDLNDDCLREVFEHLDKKGLCEVADTCKRFRGVAQETFRTSKFRTVEVRYSCDDWKHELQTIRNFGEYVESITINTALGKRHGDICEYVGRYCGTTLETFNLYCFRISDENAYKLQPALRNLHNLYICIDTEASIILKNLYSWSPKLLKLELVPIAQQVNYHKPGLRQNFPQLEEIILDSVCIDDIEAFLRLNPQLKRLSCHNDEDLILRLIATHVPGIEHLSIHGFNPPEHMTFLNQLRSLKSLDLHCDLNMGLPAFEPAIDSLENITLENFDFRDMGTQLTRLKNLQELVLDHTWNLTATHIIAVLVGCSRLRRLELCRCDDLMLSAGNLLDILRYGRALELFKYYSRDTAGSEEDRIIIDADLYLRMVSLANSRTVRGLKMNLESHSEPRLYSNKIPDALLVSHRDKLNLHIR